MSKISHVTPSPCPFCGGAASGPFRDTSADSDRNPFLSTGSVKEAPPTYYIECKGDCGAYVTGAASQAIALQRWNHRVAQA